MGKSVNNVTGYIIIHGAIRFVVNASIDVVRSLHVPMYWHNVAYYIEKKNYIKILSPPNVYFQSIEHKM